MTEIEKKAEAYAEGQLTEADSPEWPKLPRFRDNLKDELSAAYLAGAHALLDLIRERMPGEYQRPFIMPASMQYSAGIDGEERSHNALRSEILKLLDTIK